MTYKADPVTMQVIRYGLEAVADDMGYSLMRMGRTTIVKEIMEAHGGSISVMSEVTKGSVFTLRLPALTPQMFPT